MLLRLGHVFETLSLEILRHDLKYKIMTIEFIELLALGARDKQLNAHNAHTVHTSLFVCTYIGL